MRFGDPSQDLAHAVYPARPVDWIRRLKREAPELRVYAAFDPYRAGMRAELEAVHAKLAAGADGLFSQPFFDLRLLAPTLAWNRRLAEAALGWLGAHDADACFMPIRAGLDEWVGGLL